MNLEQAMGKWGQLKGKAKQVWGRALGDKTTQVAGAMQELGGVIQEKSADAAEAIERAVDPPTAK